MLTELLEVKLLHPQFHGKLLFCLVLSNFVEQQFWMPVLYCALHIVMLKPHIALGLAQFQEAVEVRYAFIKKMRFTEIYIGIVQIRTYVTIKLSYVFLTIG